MLHLEQQALDVGSAIANAIAEGENPIVLIDGRSGSGKTQFCQLLVDFVFAKSQLKVQVVHMDDLYPGWEGLRLGSELLATQILQVLNSGRVAEYQIWDWERSTRGAPNEPGNGWRVLQPGAPLVVEGCGSVSQATARYADYTIWLQSSDKDRQARLATRDQHSFDSYQELWSVQEIAFYAAENTVDLCRTVVEN